jgi:hypothetical protein
VVETEEKAPSFRDGRNGPKSAISVVAANVPTERAWRLTRIAGLLSLEEAGGWSYFTS